jgi:hypothetical protein
MGLMRRVLIFSLMLFLSGCAHVPSSGCVLDETGLHIPAADNGAPPVEAQ